MKKIANKLTKYLLLFIMFFYDMMTPLTVLADSVNGEGVSKGAVGINGEVSADGGDSVSVSATSEDGNVTVTKTVKKTDTEGKYEVSFHISGEEVETTTTSTVPVYAVVVFDRSGSMEEYGYPCLRYETGFLGRYCAEYGSYQEVKFSAAKAGAKTFASTLLGNIPNAKIGLVTFATEATIAKGFESTLSNDLSDADFGTPDGGTNLHDGLIKADEMLTDSSVPTNAKKYVVIISDGEPTYYINASGNVAGPGGSTNKAVYDNTYNKASEIKGYAEVFAIGYKLPSGIVYNRMTAAQILANMATADTDSNVQHYINADPEEVANAFSEIASNIGKVPAGTDASISDGIGTNFKITGTDGNQRTFESETIEEISKDGETITFYVDIDEDADGWVDVNNGFTLTYTDHEGNDASIVYGDTEDEKDPQVYWEGKEYKYIVNYYKDSFDTTPIASDEAKAKKDTVITSSDVDLNKYLDKSDLGTVGYEYNTINPESITISNDGTVKEINVLYTIKKFSYTVNYFYTDENNNYKDTPDSTTLANNIPYGTVVNASDYYLEESDIREGYKLDTTKSDANTYTITENGVVINIYYDKASYDYSVYYHFNNGDPDDDFTKNVEALFGTLIKASDNYLTQNELNQKYADYFLDENNDSNYEEKNVGKNNNDLNIYYINTHFSDEDDSETIDKSTSTSELTSTTTNANYTINYQSVINNVRKNDVVTITIVDTLPYEIDEDYSTLSGEGYTGVYDNDSKTITWTITKTVEAFTPVYEATANITYSVRYKDFASLSASEDNNLVNVAAGSTKVTSGTNEKTSTGVFDSASIPVNIEGTLTVIYKVDGGSELEKLGPTTEKAGTEYTTVQKDFHGYDFEKVEGRTTGTYLGDQDITVIYYYTKNEGNIPTNNVTKSDEGEVSNKNEAFNYTLTYEGRIEDYVGEATLTLTDTLPYEIDEEASSMPEECKYSNKTITCTKEYNITRDTDISEEFDLSLVYIGVDSDEVTNSVASKLELDEKTVTDDDSIVTKVAKGSLHVIYQVEGTNTILKELPTTEELAGTNYETVEEDFFGYTFDKVRDDNAMGTYLANQTIDVVYLYTKNEGKIPTNDLTKTSNDEEVSSIDGEFSYTLTYEGRIEDYVGEATLTLTDTLPYEIDEEASSVPEECKYSDKTITCTKEYNITKNTDINEEFDLVLVYIGVDSDVVTNDVTSKLELDKKTVTDEDSAETAVAKGELIVAYVDEDGNSLADTENYIDLAGISYATEEKKFEGYSLKKINGETEGLYLANETIYVEYVYAKNVGNGEVEVMPPQTGVENNSSIFLILITMLLSVLGLRKRENN